MVEGIAFYTLHFISCDADDFYLFIGLPDGIKKMSYFEGNFSLFCGITLRKHNSIKATWSVI